MNTPTKKEQKQRARDQHALAERRDRQNAQRERERERESAVEKEPLTDLKIRPLVTVSFCNVISNQLEAVIHYDALANGWMDGWMNELQLGLSLGFTWILSISSDFCFWQFFASSRGRKKRSQCYKGFFGGKKWCIVATL